MSNHEQNQRENSRPGRTETEPPRVARRDFLAVAGMATATLGGWVSSGAAAAPGDSPASGYGAAGYGEAAYGSIQ